MKKNIWLAIIFLVVVASILTFFLKKENVASITIENQTQEVSPPRDPAPSSIEQDSSIQPDANNENTEKESPQETPAKTESTNKEKDADDKTETSTLIKQNLVSWGFTQSYSRKIDTIIIHSSYDALGDEPYDVDGILKEYEMYGVSAHYLIDRKGAVYQLVKDKDIAYHAGKSSVPDGRTGVNNFSIGIEMVNTKKDKLTSSQYGSLNELIDLIETNYEIKYILGHDEIAPDRKDDPWNFDWDKIKSR